MYDANNRTIVNGMVHYCRKVNVNEFAHNRHIIFSFLLKRVLRNVRAWFILGNEMITPITPEINAVINDQQLLKNAILVLFICHVFLKTLKTCICTVTTYYAVNGKLRE